MASYLRTKAFCALASSVTSPLESTEAAAGPRIEATDGSSPARTAATSAWPACSGVLKYCGMACAKTGADWIRPSAAAVAMARPQRSRGPNVAARDWKIAVVMGYLQIEG